MNLNNIFGNVHGLGQSFHGANIHTIINYFSNPQKALKLSEEPYIFTVRKNVLGTQDFLYLFGFWFVFSFVAAVVLFFWAELGTLGVAPIQAFLAVLITVFLLSFLFGYALPVVAALTFWGKKKLEVTKEGFFLRDKKIKFEEVRSIYIKKDIKGWGVYIYTQNGIYPKMDFNVQSMHEMLALRELIAHAGEEPTAQKKLYPTTPSP